MSARGKVTRTTVRRIDVALPEAILMTITGAAGKNSPKMLSDCSLLIA